MDLHKATRQQLVDKLNSLEQEMLMDMDAKVPCAEFDELGRQIPDPEPIALPVGWVPEKSLRELLKEMIRDQLSDTAQNQGFETFEEADDFETDSDFGPVSDKELHGDQYDRPASYIDKLAPGEETFIEEIPEPPKKGKKKVLPKDPSSDESDAPDSTLT
jgi:hypothetical protein